MTTFEALSLVAQFSIFTITLLTLIISVVIFLDKKK